MPGWAAPAPATSVSRVRIVVALGGNALLRRGQPMTVQNQRDSIAGACAALAPVAMQHELVVSHGNGPQVGLLALQAAAYTDAEPVREVGGDDADDTSYPFDVLGAQTEGMIGYLIEQELGNLLPEDKALATLLTMVEVDPKDPAFGDPSKPVGPVYTEQQAQALVVRRGWTVRPDGEHWRRVVPSPLPLRFFELGPVELLLRSGCVVICAGGGGIPTMYLPGTRKLVGVEGVIDKDRACAVLARDLGADALVIATDVEAVLMDRGTPNERAVARAHPDFLAGVDFAAGSMAPKVAAAVEFAELTGGEAVIGALGDLPDLIEGVGGTRLSAQYEGITYR